MLSARVVRVVLAVALVVLAAFPALADRETAEFFAERAEKALSAGELPDAEEHFRRALEEDGTFAPARFGLARTLIAAEQRDEGLEQLKRAVRELGTETSWRSAHGKARKLLDELDENGKALRELVDEHVDDLVDFARKWMKKDRDTAVRALRAALALHPGHPKAAEMIEGLGLSPKGPPRSLFDGESLAGFIEMGPPRWKVEDGVIVGDVEDGAYIGRTVDSFAGDFDVLMEARLVKEYEGPSYFALAPAFDGKDGHYSLGLLKGRVLFQEDIDPDTDRDLYSANPPSDFDEKEWHVYELRFRGERVIALLDGEELATDTERSASRNEGFVGLTCQNCRFEIRRLEVVPR